MHRYIAALFTWICIGCLVASCASSSRKNTDSRFRAPNGDVQTNWADVPETESPNSGRLPAPYFDWPVDQARLTRGFFIKPPRGKSKRPHLGIDLAAPKGTSIYAAHDGTVIYVGREFKGFGRMIMIEGKGGWATLYAHLTKARVKEGTQVRQGDLIGDMGKTGRATGVHLHFEIRKQSGPVDPMKFLPQAPRFAGKPENPQDFDESAMADIL